MRIPELVNTINGFIKETEQLIDKIKVERRTMHPNIPPYSLYALNLLEFVSNEESLPKNEVNEINKNLSINIYSVNPISLEGILQALLSLNTKIGHGMETKVDVVLTTNKSEQVSVFIVHGHNDFMKVSVSNFVRKMGFNPIILHEQPDGGRTIIEKFQDYSDVAYAIILYSPDDEMKTGKMRARQNVIFEHGFFIGKLGQNKVVGLVNESSNIEIPSDLQGVLYKPFNSNWEIAVAKEMKHSGLDIDLNKI